MKSAPSAALTGQFSTVRQYFFSPLMKAKSPGPHDGRTVPNTDASAWLGSMDPKEWTESSIHHATRRPATPTAAPSRAAPTGFTTAYIESFGILMLIQSFRQDTGADSLDIVITKANQTGDSIWQRVAKTFHVIMFSILNNFLYAMSSNWYYTTE